MAGTDTKVCTETKAACAISGTKKFIQDGHKVKVSCNDCVCNDGKLACTKKACGCDDGKVKHGQRFKVGCNYCTCNSGGAPTSCTRKTCSPTCAKSDIESLMTRSKLQYYSRSYPKYYPT